MKIDKWIIVLVIFAFIIRIIPINFPDFTSDEARISYRAFALSGTGKDELGRSYPLLFNSTVDYQLPVVSYITSLGVSIFGKTDFGARVPFLLMGTVVVLLVYQLSKSFVRDRRFNFYSAFLTALSPGLVFFSKFPNEYIVSILLILILVILVLRERLSLLLISGIILLMILTSKVLWFILFPVLLLALFLNKKIDRKKRILFAAIGLVPVVVTIYLYLGISQGTRSLMENNFPIIFDVTIKNGIEKLRSQESLWWPYFLDRMLFNKAYFVIAGIFHWFSALNFSTLFGELDYTGSFGFLKQGALPKLAIIPFLLGLAALIRESWRFRSLLFYILIITFPLVFLYPIHNAGFIIIALPFVVLISALGLKLFNHKMVIMIFIFLILEFIVNLGFIQATVKKANHYRQGWIKQVIAEADAYSSDYKIAFSDNLTEDMVPFIEWYTEFRPEDGYENIKFPYKFHQTRISNFKLLVSETAFKTCDLAPPTYIFASERDFNKLQKYIKVLPKKIYKNYLGEGTVYLISPKVCIY